MAERDTRDLEAEENAELFSRIHFVCPPLPPADLDRAAYQDSVMSDVIGGGHFVRSLVPPELESLIALGHGFEPLIEVSDRSPWEDDGDLIEEGLVIPEAEQNCSGGCQIASDRERVNQSIAELIDSEEDAEVDALTDVDRQPVIPIRCGNQILFLDNNQVGVEGFNVGGRRVLLMAHVSGQYVMHVQPTRGEPYYIDLDTRHYETALLRLQKQLRILERQVGN